MPTPSDEEPKIGPSWIRRNPNIVAALFGLVSVVFILAVFEGLFWGLNRLYNAQNAMVYSSSIPYSEEDPVLARRPLPNVQATQKKTYNGQIVFESIYTLDAYGRRTFSRPENTPAPKSFAMFFGCSFTFGTGVADDQTLPARVEHYAPDWRSYNYAFQGYGPSQCLALLEREDLRGQVSETEGIGLFVFIPDAVSRVVGSKKVVCSWASGYNYPCYELNSEGGVTYEGSFFAAHPWRLWWYRLVNREQCLSYFKVDLPYRFSDADLTLTAAILSAARDRFVTQFPGSRFYVLMYPEHFKPAVRVFPSTRMNPFLDEKKLDVLDYANAIDLTIPGMTIEHDGHPTAKAHDLVAQKLVNDLKLNTSSTPERNPAP